MAYVGLLDCNNFFVSCERIFRPDLRTKPVVVLSSNDGCIVARSKEVKALGVPMGVPYFKVKEELTRAGTEVFSSNFPLYRDISSRVMRVLQEEVGAIEQYSVDEAFFTVPEATTNSHIELLRDIKQVVERRVGIPVSVGFGKTKTIAKYAAELGKHTDGCMVLNGSSWYARAQTVALSEVWGVGAQTAKKMQLHGLHTVADLLRTEPSRIQNIFGVIGMRLYDELSERPCMSTHDPDDLQQSIMSTRSFEKSIRSCSVLEDAIAYHVAHVCEALRAQHASAQLLRVLIRPSRHNEWVLRGGTKEVVLPLPTSDTRVILKEAQRLTRELFEAGVPYKKAGVVLSHIVPKHVRTISLFKEATDMNETLYDAVDGLNKKFGANTLTVGRLSTSSAWQSSKKNVSPHYTTDWNQIAKVVS